jgi:cystathionine beta-lyase/cystathionine gamma-synthase
MEVPMAAEQRFDTRVIHEGEGQPPEAAPLTVPIYETSTFVFDSAADVEAYNAGLSRKFLYSRYENPTVAAVERKVAALEGAEAALVFSSGMAATATTLMALTGAGDEVVCTASLYGGTLHLLGDLLSRFGVSARFVELADLADPDRALSDRTLVFWFESPTNPTLRIVDMAAVASACRRRGVVSVIDSTFASPVNQQPLALGVDLVMHSATKYLGGHSDITAGAIAGSAALVARVAAARRLLGTVLDPQPAYALGRSLKTLSLRVARHNANAAAVAAFLEQDPRVSRVFYPGLSSHPDHALARRQMRGFGGMVCVDLEGSFERACRVFDRLQVFRRAASLGGVESLCSLPILTSQAGYTDEQLARAGVTRGMLRLSVGLEDPADLTADLDQALG